MNNNDAVFEHIINQLRAHCSENGGDKYKSAYETWQEKTDWVQSYQPFDMHNPWGKHRADVMREHILYQEGEIQSLKNQLRDSSEQIKGLHKTICDLNDIIGSYKRVEEFRKIVCEPEQAGCRKEDTQVEEPWIKWEGGVCPVPPGTLVDVVYRCGEQRNNLPANVVTAAPWDASYLYWRHDNAKGDIIRYRVVKPECEHVWEQSLGQFFATCVKCGKVG